MQGKRIDKVADLIRNEIGMAILRLRDPRIGFVTITRVDLSADLHYAKVLYSVLALNSGKPENKPIDLVRKETHEALTSARGFLQRDLAEVLNLRYTPHLDFILDDSIEQNISMEGILKDTLEKEDE